METVVLILLLTGTTLAQRPYFTRIGESQVGQKGRQPRRIKHPEILTRWQTKPNIKPGPLPDPADPADPPDHVPRSRHRVPEFTPLGERGRYIPVHDPTPVGPNPAPAPITAKESVMYPVRTPATASVYDVPPTPVPISAGSVERNLPPTRTKTGPPPSHRTSQVEQTANKARPVKRLISSGTQAADSHTGGNERSTSGSVLDIPSKHQPGLDVQLRKVKMVGEKSVEPSLQNQYRVPSGVSSGNPNMAPSPVPQSNVINVVQRGNPYMAPLVVPKGNSNMATSVVPKGNPNMANSVVPKGNSNMATSVVPKGNPNMAPSVVSKGNPNMAPLSVQKGNHNKESSAVQRGNPNRAPQTIQRGNPLNTPSAVPTGHPNAAALALPSDLNSVPRLRVALFQTGSATLPMPPTRTKVGPPPISKHTAVPQGNIKTSPSEPAKGISVSKQNISTDREHPMSKHVSTGQTVLKGNIPLERYPQGDKPVAAPPTQTTVAYRQVPVTVPASPPLRLQSLSDKRPLSEGTLITLPPSRTKVGPPPLREPSVTIRPTPKVEAEGNEQKKVLPSPSKSAVIPPTRTKSGPPPRRNNQRIGRQNTPPRDSPSPTDIRHKSRNRDSLIVRGPPPPSFRQYLPPVYRQTRPEARKTKPVTRQGPHSAVNTQTRPEATETGPVTRQGPPSAVNRQVIPNARETRPVIRQGLPSAVNRQTRPAPLARPPTRTKSLGNLAGPGPVYAPIVPTEPTAPPTMYPPTTAFMTFDQPEVKREEEEES